MTPHKKPQVAGYLDGKLTEAARSTLPVILIVLLLCMTITPVPPDVLLCFLLGSVMVILGVALFNLGADSAMTPAGKCLGAAMTGTKNLPFILISSLILGFSITIAEPDLLVLAKTVPHISTTLLLVSVGIGVGIFLMLCMLRILFGWKLRWLLIILYGLIFAVAAFTDDSFLSVAFDSGGVTTGPMTVPFILAFGMGVSRIRSDRRAEADSFGLVALCSVGPIMVVLVLGFFLLPEQSSAAITLPSFADTAQVGSAYLRSLPVYLKEMCFALLPIAVIFSLFQLLFIKMPGRAYGKILLGFLCTLVGLTLFLCGVNVGFSALGYVLGQQLATGWTRYLLIPLAMLLGWVIISAEPAVAVLEEQIQEVSAGNIPEKAIRLSLQLAISLAMGFSMLRVITGVSILWFLIPGYLTALILTFFVPSLYTAIAFDSGGVASGPMTATFMLQLVMGASFALGGNVLQDAFGVVAMVAMMPLVSVQLLGILYRKKGAAEHSAPPAQPDDTVIELW